MTSSILYLQTDSVILQFSFVFLPVLLTLFSFGFCHINSKSIFFNSSLIFFAKLPNFKLLSAIQNILLLVLQRPSVDFFASILQPSTITPPPPTLFPSPVQRPHLLRILNRKDFTPVLAIGSSMLFVKSGENRQYGLTVSPKLHTYT
jgi:hypothetical protein